MNQNQCNDFNVGDRVMFTIAEWSGTRVPGTVIAVGAPLVDGVCYYTVASKFSTLEYQVLAT